jgi:hypothetical protein
MKSISLLTALLITVLSSAQDIEMAKKVGIPLKDDQAFYEVIDSSKGSAAQLFTAAKMAMSEIYRNSKGGLQVEDKDLGVIRYKAAAPVPFKGDMGVKLTGRMFYLVEISVKDGKYRIQMHDFTASPDEDALKGSPLLEIYTKGIMNSKKYRERFLTSAHLEATSTISVIRALIEKNVSNTSSEW